MGDEHIARPVPAPAAAPLAATSLGRVLGLQRGVGNRAVVALLGASPDVAPVVRRVVNDDGPPFFSSEDPTRPFETKPEALDYDRYMADRALEINVERALAEQRRLQVQAFLAERMRAEAEAEAGAVADARAKAEKAAERDRGRHAAQQTRRANSDKFMEARPSRHGRTRGPRTEVVKRSGKPQKSDRVRYPKRASAMVGPKVLKLLGRYKRGSLGPVVRQLLLAEANRSDRVELRTKQDERLLASPDIRMDKASISMNHKLADSSVSVICAAIVKNLQKNGESAERMAALVAWIGAMCGPAQNPNIPITFLRDAVAGRSGDPLFRAIRIISNGAFNLRFGDAELNQIALYAFDPNRRERRSDDPVDDDEPMTPRSSAIEETTRDLWRAGLAEQGMIEEALEPARWRDGEAAPGGAVSSTRAVGGGPGASSSSGGGGRRPLSRRDAALASLVDELAGLNIPPLVLLDVMAEMEDDDEDYEPDSDDDHESDEDEYDEDDMEPEPDDADDMEPEPDDDGQVGGSAGMGGPPSASSSMAPWDGRLRSREPGGQSSSAGDGGISGMSLRSMPGAPPAMGMGPPMGPSTPSSSGSGPVWGGGPSLGFVAHASSSGSFGLGGMGPPPSFGSGGGGQPGWPMTFPGQASLSSAPGPMGGVSPAMPADGSGPSRRRPPPIDTSGGRGGPPGSLPRAIDRSHKQTGIPWR